MRKLAKAAGRTVAVLILTFFISGHIAWFPGYAPALVSLVDTSAWRALRSADAWLRLSLGARVGPESDKMLFVWCSLALSLLLAVTIVWVAERLFRRLTASRRATPSRRPASAVL